MTSKESMIHSTCFTLQISHYYIMWKKNYFAFMKNIIDKFDIHSEFGYFQL